MVEGSDELADAATDARSLLGETVEAAKDANELVRSARPVAGLGYAEDALDWHHCRQDTPLVQRRSDGRRLEVWRRDNWIDAVRNVDGGWAAGH